MHGNSNEQNTHNLKLRVEELEKANYSLSKKVNELQGIAEGKEVEIRTLSKRIKNQDESEKNHKLMLENFTKQAKDQYKKYENYLDCAEDLLNYTLIYFKCLHDMIHATLDSALLDNKVNLNSYFDYENKTAIENNVKTIIERFSKSQFLEKKKLFVDIKKKINIKGILKLAEISEKVEKFRDDAPKQKQPKSVSIGVDDNPRDEFFEISYHQLIECMNKFKEVLVDGLYTNFNEDALSNILTSTSSLGEELFKYLNRFKKDLGGEPSNIQTFNSDIDALKKQFDNLEKLEYNKLIDLREKNNKLQIIQNHIKNLSKENEELTGKINSNEFNLLVNNEIILAYEKNIREKEDTLKDKYAKLEQAKGLGDDLNQRIAKLTLEIIGLLNRC